MFGEEMYLSVSLVGLLFVFFCPF
uniref:Uncharacterized protein n=1 Tax=Anguilla anguilla TaxID=7936 RepID=A0A0E9U5L9_ANGAN